MDKNRGKANKVRENQRAIKKISEVPKFLKETYFRNLHQRKTKLLTCNIVITYERL